MRYFFRYADDLLAITKANFCDILLDPSKPRSDDLLDWLYPLRTEDGSIILDFESEPAVADKHGVASVDFLCMSISLRPAGRMREVSYRPYNVRNAFTFHFPTLSRYDSFTPSSVLKASISTMLPYAIIGSSSLESSVAFMRAVIDKLCCNKYPKAVLLDMWRRAVAKDGLMYMLPCREPLASQRDKLARTIERHIASCFRK